MRRYKDWDIWSDNKLYQLSQCMNRLRKGVKVFEFFFFSLHLLQSATSAEKNGVKPHTTNLRPGE